jgi:lipid-A-disaccharide synthase
LREIWRHSGEEAAMRIFFSVGEPSGDLHGANLIHALRERTALQATGLGGPKLQAAGCELLRDMSDLAVVGIFPALARLPQYFRLLADVERELDRQRPDAVVLIDYPGFNWHVARAAKERGIAVCYYGLPQLWAWASWRVRKVQRFVDHALCKLPFEEAWFREHGCQAVYVGHPYFDELAAQRLDEGFLAEQRRAGGRLVTILPGSRDAEVRCNLPMLLAAAAQVRREVRDAQIAIASYSERQAALARELVAAGPVPAQVFVGRTSELISAADCCLACSGSVSLELLYHAKPSVIVYRVSWWTYQLAQRLVNVRYITLVNLLASEQPLSARRGGRQKLHLAAADEAPLFPEYPTWRDCSAQVAEHAIGWLTDEAARQRLIARLESLRERYAVGGASQAAADYIIRALSPENALPLRRAS